MQPCASTFANPIIAVRFLIFIASPARRKRKPLSDITNEYNALDKAAYFQASWGKAYRYFDMEWTFKVSNAVFELGSLLCGVAPNFDAFTVGRAIAGSGVAGMGTGGYIIVAYVVELAKPPSCTGIMGLNYCFASGLGPLVGGAITTRELLQADFVGAVLVLGSLISCGLATQYGWQTNPWGSGTVVGLLVIAVVLVGIFAVWEWHVAERAMIALQLLMQQSAGIGSAFAFLFAGSYSIDNASRINSGVDTLPLILASTVAVISAGLAITKTGHTIPLRVAGAVIATVGSGLLYTLDIGTSSGKWIALSDPKDISSITVIILFEYPGTLQLFLSVGGGLLVNAAQSAFVNRLLITLPGGAPGVDQGLMVATGALALQSTFSEDQLPGIPEAYMAGIKTAFAISLAACGISTLAKGGGAMT
ncbi:major facilitator superfamily domain-containing protein [Xylaria sp. FL0043]|nr:major facilitator superfamily domain-containing protein [Xylaria sp. FL0043]